MTNTEASFTAVFAAALRGAECSVRFGDSARPLPVGSWQSGADRDDRAMLDHCDGPTIDVGCGPGRLTAALAERGHVVLGIDVVREAVGQTRARGAAALHRDVFGEVPGEGRWFTALLADGNVGIGGDPVALLRRLRRLVVPGGRVVVELAPPGVASRTVLATLECDGARSRPFRWSVVGVEGVAPIAEAAGLRVASRHAHGERWCAVLEDTAA